MFTRILLIPTLTLVLAASTAFAQDVSLQLIETSEIEIEGTSNIRDWGATTNTISATLVLNGYDPANLQNLTPESFKQLALSLPVESLDSGTRGLTRNMHDYLKADDYPTIRFELNRITEIQHEENGVILTAEGVVNAAGKDHAVTMNVQAKIDDTGALIFTGTQNLKMTDFDIKPPTAVFGTVRAVDEMSIHYTVKFQN